MAQHPEAQVAEVHPLHCCPVHVWGDGHVWQAPPLPHAVASVPARHWPPWQQPLAQLVASHTHCPAAHRCPAPHAGPFPHRQAPP
ncbi:MAG: hypothetical protein INH41_08285 [Myxococcaceae bacterium]|nr:hypothetical protein [Myxococcaceae bacterium]